MTSNWTTVLHRHLRRTPPNWSTSDWREEIKAHCAAASWQAMSEYDSSRGVPLKVFVHQRVLADVYTRYRQECRYARRYGYEFPLKEKPFEGEGSFYPAEFVELLFETLAQLSETDGWLLKQLYWEGLTEAEVAHAVGISQPAVNRRKQLILRELRRFMSEKKSPPRL